MLLVNDNVFEWRYPSPFAKADVTFDGGRRNMFAKLFQSKFTWFGNVYAQLFGI